MKQQTFSDLEYASRRRQTKRENFLNSMDAIIPWSQWVEIIRPHYPKGERGRKPLEIETMLRMYLLQNWFNLSDEGIEDAIYDSYAIRTFMRIDFLKKQAPDATTLLHFRHLIETNGIAKQIFDDVRDRLDKAGLLMHGGTVVDATIVAAPSSTKNQSGQRDPEMHQTKKGNEWRYGMKIHSGVDAGSGYVHTITATSANEHDITETAKLVREDDAVVYGDSGYLGIEKREDIRSDNNLRQVDFRINKRPSQNKIPAHYKGTNWDKQIENRKSSTRCKVEHPFLIVKRQFGYSKVSYRGLAKNLNRFFMLFASANLVMCIRAGRQKEFCGV